eukprot:1154300-Pelagomonas_calceolata.AAC.2
MKSRKTQTPPPPRKCSKHATDSDASRLVACKNSGSTSKASGSGSMQKQWQWQWQWQWQHARTVAVSCKSSVMKPLSPSSTTLAHGLVAEAPLHKPLGHDLQQHFQGPLSFKTGLEKLNVLGLLSTDIPDSQQHRDKWHLLHN